MELTNKEKQVLIELMAGKRNAEIAQALNVSVNTIKTHLSRMYTKTGVKGRTALVIKQLELENQSRKKTNL